jgi:hypothetical protein
MRWGRFPLLCARYPTTCFVCLSVRFYWYAHILQTSSVIKRRKTMTEILMKIMMGGWIPQGKRSQTLAAAVAIGAIITAVVQWGSGDMTGMNLLHLLQEKWEVIAAAYVAYFVAEKIDAKK